MIQVFRKDLMFCLLLTLIALPEVTSAPHELIKFTIGAYILPDKSLSMELDVVAPRSPK
jgi:hypothetical protein